MIIKGKAASDVRYWTRYLPEQGKNKRVTEHEIWGTLSRGLKGALEEMRDIASVTRCKGNFMYHASLHPEADEKLTREQWMRATAVIEEELGFGEHQRVIYEHVKEGRQRFHVLWSRVNPDTITIKDIRGDQSKLRRAANQLKKEFGLKPVKEPSADATISR